MLGLYAGHVQNGLVLAPLSATLHRSHLLDLFVLPVTHVLLVGSGLARTAAPALHGDDLVAARRVVLNRVKILVNFEHRLELVAVAEDEAKLEEA